MENPQEIRAEWDQWAIEAEKSKSELRPKVVMKDVPAPKGYKAQICTRKNPDRNAGQHHEFLCRVLIWNENTGAIVYDYGKWVAPHHVHKKLGEALKSLEEVVKLRGESKP